MSSAQPSNQEIIRVWADIGGTFTDCFVLANHQRREIKVLSSGLTRTKVRSHLGDHRFSLESFPGADIPHFWNGASAILSDQKGHMIDLGNQIIRTVSRLELRTPIHQHLPISR